MNRFFRSVTLSLFSASAFADKKATLGSFDGFVERMGAGAAELGRGNTGPCGYGGAARCLLEPRDSASAPIRRIPPCGETRPDRAGGSARRRKPRREPYGYRRRCSLPERPRVRRHQ